MKTQLINFLSHNPFINNYFSGMATIFMLHRVAPFETGKLLPNENMKVSPEFLENFIIELKNKDYRFISLDELYEILQKQKKVEKCIVFTLDDGYIDNYEIAYPIFKQYNVPFAVYITTAFPNKNALLWWYAIEELIIGNDELLIENKKYSSKSYKEKNRLFMQLRNKIMQLEQKQLQDELDNMFENYSLDWSKWNKKLCMSWQNIIEMSKDELCTIAGHTKNHYVFKKLQRNEIISEVVEANYEIEKKIGKKVEHFAYPFGNRGEVGIEEMKIVKELGLKTVTTTRGGNIYLKHKKFSSCCLPRIMLKENFKLKDIGRMRRKRIITL